MNGGKLRRGADQLYTMMIAMVAIKHRGDLSLCAKELEIDLPALKYQVKRLKINILELVMKADASKKGPTSVPILEAIKRVNDGNGKAG